MANNFQVNVYQINQNVMVRDAPQRIGFPSTGVMLRDCSTSPARSLASGYNVYGIVQTSDGTQYYCAETIAQLAVIVG
jgi:hypothetical protein